MTDPLHETGRISITAGMARAMSIHGAARMCPHCKLGIPKYVGRYPNKCPRCKGSMKLDEAGRAVAAIKKVFTSDIPGTGAATSAIGTGVRKAAGAAFNKFAGRDSSGNPKPSKPAAPPRDKAPVVSKTPPARPPVSKTPKLTKPVLPAPRSTGPVAGVKPVAKTKPSVPSFAQPKVTKPAFVKPKPAPKPAPAAPSFGKRESVLCEPRTNRLRKILAESGVSHSHDAYHGDPTCSKAMTIPYGLIEGYGGIEGFKVWLEGPTDDGTFYRVESIDGPVMCFTFLDEAERCRVFATEAPTRYLGFDPREEMIREDHESTFLDESLTDAEREALENLAKAGNRRASDLDASPGLLSRMVKTGLASSMHTRRGGRKGGYGSRLGPKIYSITAQGREALKESLSEANLPLWSRRPELYRADQGDTDWWQLGRTVDEAMSDLVSSLGTGKRPTRQQINKHKTLSHAIKRKDAKKTLRALSAFISMILKVPSHWQDRLFDLSDFMKDLRSGSMSESLNEDQTLRAVTYGPEMAAQRNRMIDKTHDRVSGAFIEDMRASMKRRRKPGEGPTQVRGPFRIHVGANKTRKPRKDVAMSLQNKMNAKRGLRGRIQGAKKWHQSRKGQDLHQALAHYNRGRSKAEEHDAALRGKLVDTLDRIKRYNAGQQRQIGTPIVEVTNDPAGGGGGNPSQIQQPTAEDHLEGILRKLIVSNDMDVLQDVHFDERDGGMYLFFDPILMHDEVQEILMAVRRERGDIDLIASPDGSLPGESVESLWWVLYAPGPMGGGPSPDIYGAEPDQHYTKAQMVINTPPSPPEALAQGVDISKLIKAAGENR